jgi:ABC-type sugar transport system substrate-binding protein
VNASGLKGKRIAVVANNLEAAQLLLLSQGIQKTGSALGISVEVLDGDATAAGDEQAMQQAIGQHVAGIVLVGVADNLVPAGLADAKSAKIPVVGTASAEPVAGTAGQGGGADVFAEASTSYQLGGQLIADSAIAESGGKPVKAVIETLDSPQTNIEVKAIEQTFASCSFCSVVQTVEMSPAQFATNLASATASAIRVQSGINWVFPAVDSMASYTLAGIEQAGLQSSVKVATYDGASDAALGAVQRGGPLVMDAGASDQWISSLVWYQLIAALTGEAPGDPIVPVRYLDQTDLKGLDLTSPTALYGDASSTGFAALGLKQ